MFVREEFQALDWTAPERGPRLIAAESRRGAIAARWPLVWPIHSENEHLERDEGSMVVSGHAADGLAGQPESANRNVADAHRLYSHLVVVDKLPALLVRRSRKLAIGARPSNWRPSKLLLVLTRLASG